MRERQKNKRDFLSHRLVGSTTQPVYMWMWYYHQTPFTHFLQFFWFPPIPIPFVLLFYTFFPPLFLFIFGAEFLYHIHFFSLFLCTYIIITSPPMFPNIFLARYKWKLHFDNINKFYSFFVIFFPLDSLSYFSPFSSHLLLPLPLVCSPVLLHGNEYIINHEFIYV